MNAVIVCNLKYCGNDASQTEHWYWNWSMDPILKRKKACRFLTSLVR